jgi:hypothetical protein
MKTNNTVINKRTKGVYGVAENHIVGNDFNYTILSNMSTVICEVMRHNFKSVGRNKFKTKTRLHPDKEAKANATFIVTACNNHDALVEALKEITVQYESVAEEYCRLHGCKYNEKEFQSIVVAKQLLNQIKEQSNETAK